MIALMRYDSVYKTIYDYCEQRAQCYASCVRDNFPEMKCREVQTELEYNGNSYSRFFFYPVPAEHKLAQYRMCQDYIGLNPGIEWTSRNTPDEPRRQLRIHTCFTPCKETADCLTGFDFD